MLLRLAITVKGQEYQLRPEEAAVMARGPDRPGAQLGPRHQASRPEQGCGQRGLAEAEEARGLQPEWE